MSAVSITGAGVTIRDEEVTIDAPSKVSLINSKVSFPCPIIDSFLLLEDSCFVLLEDGCRIKLEISP